MKLKIITLILINVSFAFNLAAQDFDSKLERLAEDLSNKINTKGKKKVAVWGFVTEGGERTSLGNFLTEDFSVYITNFGENYQVIDRKHLDIILKEHKLNSEGYIDEKTAKELQKIIAVDAIITGTYTVLNKTIKIRAKVLDTETALQFGANMSSLPLNEDVASYLGISVSTTSQGSSPNENSTSKGNTTNREFNTPINSNETINNPETVDSKCKETSTGDICFSNSLNEKVIVRIAYYHNATYHRHSKYKTIILDANETKCAFGIINRPITFYIAKWTDFVDDKKFKGSESWLTTYYPKFLKDKGELKIEACRSKTYTIK